jgi:hypothetical protein
MPDRRELSSLGVNAGPRVEGSAPGGAPSFVLEESRMNDASIHEAIEALVAEEHELWHRGEAGTLDDAGRGRLNDISVQLDRFYDLLHQRRGLIDAGSDPNKASLRSAKTVEGYVE